MKFKTYSASALIALAALSVAACGGDDGSDGGAGGAPSNSELSKEIEELKEQIAALQELLDAGEGNQQMLQDALDDAQDRLAELETCASGGDCQTRDETVGDLAVLSDAYCDWLFGCCSADETTAGVSAAITDADSCKAVYRSFLSNGTGLSLNFEGTNLQTSLLYRLQDTMADSSTISERIESGRIALSDERLQECVSLIEAQGCGDEAESCVDQSQVLQACEGFIDGLQTEGEPCAGTGECAEGLLCDTDIYGGYFSGYGLALNNNDIDGKCVAEPEVGDPCSNQGQCGTVGQDLYCDQNTGTCQERPGAGETCAFRDELFFEGFSMAVPCQPGLTCGLTTKTCVSECEQDSRCYRYGSNARECAPGLVCNVTDDREGTGLESEETNTGFCDEAFPKGKEATDSDECASGGRSGGVCQGLGGEDCTSDSECRSGACEGNVCLTYCGGDFEDACGAEEFCEGGVRCRPTVGLNDNCVSGEDEECAVGLCVAGTCREPVETGEDCNGYDDLCDLDDFCAYTEGGTKTGYECVARLAEDASCSGNRDCQEGLGCFGGTCLLLTDRPNGDACGNEGFRCASERCFDGACRAGKAEGEACDADPADNGSVNTDIDLDECAAGLYCRPNATPSTSKNMPGTCTAQGAPGTLCDTSIIAGLPQCEGDFSCEESSERQAWVCPVVYEDGEGPEACILDDVPYVEAPSPNLLPSEGPIVIIKAL